MQKMTCLYKSFLYNLDRRVRVYIRHARKAVHGGLPPPDLVHAAIWKVTEWKRKLLTLSVL